MDFRYRKQPSNLIPMPNVDRENIIKKHQEIRDVLNKSQKLVTVNNTILRSRRHWKDYD